MDKKIGDEEEEEERLSLFLTQLFTRFYFSFYVFTHDYASAVNCQDAEKSYSIH